MMSITVKKVVLFMSLMVFLLNTSLVRPNKEFKIFQFPQNQIPRIDGDFSDWEMVPDNYMIGVKELKNTKFGEGLTQDPKDFDLNVKVGWVKDLNRLYFFIEAYDNYWDFDNPVLKQDIFELVVDADLSGGPFIYKNNSNVERVPLSQLYFKSHGAHAQNYHIFTPAKDKDWAMPWGNTPWIKEFPYSLSATKYNFKHGESGKLLMEFYITPYDHASFDGPKSSIESKLNENEIIGLSWSILDFDGGKICHAFRNLSHDLRMINDGSFLCAFRLMPLEDKYEKSLDSNWSFVAEDRDKRIIRFYDKSIGNITKWHWDFGDGTTSNEKNPIHQYKEGKEWAVLLTVEGPNGKSTRSKVWDVVTQ